VRYPGNNAVYSRPVATFLCPSYSSNEPYGVVTIDGVVFGSTGYVPNALISAKNTKNPITTDPQARTRLDVDVPDGTSYTILHAEKYSRCTNSDPAIDPAFHDGGAAWAYCTSPLPQFNWQPRPMKPPAKGFQPGFAIPILKLRGAPYVTGPESLFQSQPKEDDCDPTRASTAHSIGMVTGFVDGNVRILPAGMSGELWWAAVTPNEGERPNFDW
jgi:hypothetical protein